MIKKVPINMTIDKNLLNYIDSHFHLPGLKRNRSQFIESCIKDKIKGTIKPEDHLKNEIKFHEDKRKFHDDILAELYIKEKRLKGEIKLIPTKTFSELKNNSDRLISNEKEKDIEAIMEPVSLNQENMNKSELEMREKALKIIDG